MVILLTISSSACVRSNIAKMDTMSTMQNESSDRKYRAPIKNLIFEYTKSLRLLARKEISKDQFLDLFTPAAFVYNDFDQNENREIGIDVYAIDIFNYFKEDSFDSEVVDDRQSIIKQIYSIYSDAKTIDDQWQMKDGVKYFSVVLNKEIRNVMDESFNIIKLPIVRKDKIELIVKVSEEHQKAKIAKINLIETNYE